LSGTLIGCLQDDSTRTFNVGNSDAFVAGEEIGDLECGGIGGIGAMRAIVADAGAEVASNAARSGLLGIGGAHGVAPFVDGIFSFQDEGENLAGGHEVGEFTEKRALFVN